MSAAESVCRRHILLSRVLRANRAKPTPGGFCLQLSKIYPDLGFIVQDRAPVLAQAQREIWPRENPQALNNGRVKFLEHNFFDPNPVVGADIYWLRYIL
jgi:hypothetical protein